MGKTCYAEEHYESCLSPGPWCEKYSYHQYRDDAGRDWVKVSICDRCTDGVSDEEE